MSEERLFTKDEVSAIVKRRLKGPRGGLPDDVEHALLRSILERLDRIEARLGEK